MNKKESIKNIIDKKTRLSGCRSFELISKKFSQLESAFKNINNNELLKYLPIAIVASIESYYKILIKEIIDEAGHPYTEKALELLDCRYSLKRDEIIPFHHKIVTLGDLISYSIPIKDFGSINNIMSNLFACDFKNELCKTINWSEYKLSGKKQTPIIKNINETISQLSKIYKLRHEFCHEPGFNYTVNKDELMSSFNNIKALLEATQQFVDHKISPDAPVTQFEINEESRKSYRESEKKLLNIENQIKAFFSRKDSRKFASIQLKWRKSRDADADFFSREEVGGTIWFCIFYSYLKQINDNRISMLTELFPEIDKPFMKS